MVTWTVISSILVTPEASVMLSVGFSAQALTPSMSPQAVLCLLLL